MGRPNKCLPNTNPFLSYTTAIDIVTTTIAPEDISKYIVIPESGAICPSITTTSTSTTTLPPLVVDAQNNICNSYSVQLLGEIGCIKSNPVEVESAIIRYQPCGSGILTNEIIYYNTILCVVKDKIRLLAGNADIELLEGRFCDAPCPCDITINLL